jgi:aryl-alcohol dehydrogenase-like predicted oxidoreductase
MGETMSEIGYPPDRMDFHSLGQSGLKVPPMAFGSWLNLLGAHSDSPQALVDASLEAGVNFFDTADVYDFGRAEEALGQALAPHPRHLVVVATKAYFPMSDDANDRGLSRKHLKEGLDRSLQRLGMDYVDLFQCHRYDEETPLQETVQTMGELIRTGKTHYWGTSMWSAEQLQQACTLCDELGVPRPVSEQARLSLLCREVDAEVLPQAQQLGMGFLWWSPLAQGILSGKYHHGQAPPADSRAASQGRVGTFLDDALASAEVHQRVSALREVAAEAGCSMATLSLAWCLHHAPQSSVLIGATSKAQLAENLAALELPWSPDLAAAVERAMAGPSLGF